MLAVILFLPGVKSGTRRLQESALIPALEQKLLTSPTLPSPTPSGSGSPSRKPIPAVVQQPPAQDPRRKTSRSGSFLRNSAGRKPIPLRCRSALVKAPDTRPAPTMLPVLSYGACGLLHDLTPSCLHALPKRLGPSGNQFRFQHVGNPLRGPAVAVGAGDPTAGLPGQRGFKQRVC